MKIIALLPFKNEELMLPTYLSSMKLIADQIIAIDDGSTDNSRSIIEASGGLVVSSKEITKTSWAEQSIRNNLLRLGRENGGTHFICLDADEALTASFIKNYKNYFNLLKPGQSLYLQWLALWKNPYCYRKDNSIWSDNFKDFIFCDDQISQYGSSGFLHSVRRTPGVNDPSKRVTVPLVDGAVFHFQFSSWRNYQIKQSLFRCWEFVERKFDAIKVNSAYSITLDDPKALVAAAPQEWYQGLVMPELDDTRPTWHYQAIIEMFNQYGIDVFEPLQIWHIAELKEEFVRRVGRPPVSKAEPRLYGIIRKRVVFLKKKIKNVLISIRQAKNSKK